jgi:hypothetical protein
MIEKCAKQNFFMDIDYICERLVRQDSFYRKFKELVTRSFQTSILQACTALTMTDLLYRRLSWLVRVCCSFIAAFPTGSWKRRACMI